MSGSSRITSSDRASGKQVALRVVSRENLERIYEKVSKEKGKGNRKGFLGEETAVGLNRKFDSNLCPKPPMVSPINRASSPAVCETH
jgi:hypothetical protein